MQKLLMRVYCSKKISMMLKIISYASVVIGVASFLAMLVHFFLVSLLSAMKLACAFALPFLLVSATRRIINAPRPYELYSFYEVKPKRKCGRSFPSRHVFSAAAIATLACSISVWLAIALFLATLSLAVSRVLLGIHFLRDVVAGAAIGILSGIIGILFI